METVRRVPARAAARIHPAHSRTVQRKKTEKRGIGAG
jgi:hypothetical protein